MAMTMQHNYVGYYQNLQQTVQALTLDVIQHAISIMILNSALKTSYYVSLAP